VSRVSDDKLDTCRDIPGTQFLFSEAEYVLWLQIAMAA